ncbi:AAA family ATPase [Flavobacterium sp. KACC 22761]|uniref:AAA family ATPase n=1 Tax=Flavobacterium sp. KACC 22761 TaxID=3092665 RepID=UPI002A75813E|nr:AAA family ATPase [Flavobacterium sp. KACC 22761]WPO79600.1 AAA family ATPase [Flavobacterium sp. KACC 22761]
MKISKLHIDQFRHLENLEFDFTYPEDFHIEEKRGKPLDKICFIGQSATGKTGLLELIKDQHTVVNNIIINGITFTYKKDIPKSTKTFASFDISDNILEVKNDKLNFNEKKFHYVDAGGTFSNLLNDHEKKHIYYFKANLISEKNIELFTKNPIDIFEKYPKLDNRYNIDNYFSKEEPIIFDDNIDDDLWLVFLKEILEYRKKFNQKMSELIHKGLLANAKKLSSEFDKWQKDNPNKVEIFAEKFNPLLEKLNLEVDKVNTEYTIPIINKRTEEIIPIQQTSTGTKGLLLSFLPLYKLDTKDSIILIDEPERSLYPDMQMELMDHYKNLAPEAQFIVATHSPFIAASFEPEERFILHFDNEGKVAVRRGISPIGDDPNDMLFNDFGVNYYNDDVQEKFKEYLELLDKVKSENNKELKKKYLLEASKLGNQYNFILDEKNKERLQ